MSAARLPEGAGPVQGVREVREVTSLGVWV
ncbi:hypothetical protein GGD71_000986 [Variovorax guangxiensis]|uniref:Uncharacterized protein n=1 Tax=Variovorax guangxiensis TaxID=1775474 RepID=A0A840FKU7_9BURK|nr:hypothetical protein [Variovorax guangxiensis]